MTAAQAIEGNNRSVTPWRVEIETADCGSINYLKALTEDDARKMASELETSASYEFKLGVLSRWAVSSPIKVMTPSAQDVRNVGSAGK